MQLVVILVCMYAPAFLVFLAISFAMSLLGIPADRLTEDFMIACSAALLPLGFILAYIALNRMEHDEERVFKGVAALVIYVAMAIFALLAYFMPLWATVVSALLAAILLVLVAIWLKL
jgi:hypothetical protein